MVLILGISQDFAGNELLVRLVFGVVSASLFIQGLSIKGLLRRLSLSGAATESEIDVEIGRARIVANTQALHRLEMRRKEGVVDEHTSARAQRWYQQALGQAQTRVNVLQERMETIQRSHDVALALELMEVEVNKRRAEGANSVCLLQIMTELMVRQENHMQKSLRLSTNCIHTIKIGVCVIDNHEEY